ncbi:MAG: hypothetical protein SWK76_14165 [Actinomycetota bacterium]|nr:hypothetical protein [Actinomycetota bacterium]
MISPVRRVGPIFTFALERQDYILVFELAVSLFIVRVDLSQVCIFVVIVTGRDYLEHFTKLQFFRSSYDRLKPIIVASLNLVLTSAESRQVV